MTRLAATTVLVLVAAAVASAQPMTRCASCHLANMTRVPAPEHLGEWQRSAHAKQGVGCHECHGGDPWTYVAADLHKGILSPAHAASPVNGSNLTQTCARCHRADAQAFAHTMHAALAHAGERRAPTCTTCHGAMRAVVPSPAALERQCAECHPAGSVRAEYPALLRTSIEALNALGARADALDEAIKAVPEHARRVELLVALYNARAALKTSIAAVHGFDVRQVNERVDVARRELDAVASSANAAIKR